MHPIQLLSTAIKDVLHLKGVVNITLLAALAGLQGRAAAAAPKMARKCSCT